MDKINLKDERVVERIRSYFNAQDMGKEEIANVLEELTDEEKEELIDFIEDEEILEDEDYEEKDDIEEIDDIDEDDDEDEPKIKRSESTAITPITRSDMMKMSDLTNEEIVEQFQKGNQNALAALVEKNQGLVRSRASYFYRSHGNDLDLEDLVQSGMLGMIRAAEKFDLTLGYKFTTYAYKWIDKAIRKAINKEGHTIRIPAGKYLKLNKLKQILKANPEASDEEIYKILEKEGIDKKQADDLFLINRNQVNSTSLNINLDSEDSTGDELMDMVGDESTPVDMLILERDMENFLMQALEQLTERERQIIIYRYGLDNEKPKTLEEIGSIYDLSRERIRQIENQALGKLKEYSDAEN
ncbi:sigma-70 family RNA polymerase sigma factor [Anaerococcus sp. mt242]|uniref:sigma-70 family RNA polymerase sigma factor n=1 Tax=Anaerococcus sp. mt242 TaxID=2661917 RepID=UPI001931391C|nr:sigma-70 family RNA polymerase sigma factor [Anaerococcus sp. mt242]MBM0046832.1 sigma-70 family RNA polymerase sigma factor [Anaerococcus sp. mt242]